MSEPCPVCHHPDHRGGRCKVEVGSAKYRATYCDCIAALSVDDEFTIGHACKACGFHPRSSSMWCDAGCGSDYNEMREVIVVGNEPKATVVAEVEWFGRTGAVALVAAANSAVGVRVEGTDD